MADGENRAYRPKWATRRWRLIYRLLHAIPADEAERYVTERNEWQQRISDAAGVTWQELHGGGATIYGTLDECERAIRQMRAVVHGA